jgi:hypothetical protein
MCGPAVTAHTLYAAWVRNGPALSAPVLVNLARVTMAEFEQVASGYQFRVFGRNMVLPGATPNVTLRDTTTGAALPASTVADGSDAYQLRLQAPAGLVPGHRYAVEVTNGAGGATGVTTSRQQLTAITARPDPYGLGVPWLSNFGFLDNVYNVKTDPRLGTKLATGDGVTNDIAAVRNAIAVAAKAGGGVVYLPAGTYKLTSEPDANGLDLGSNIVLRGDGMDKTKIVNNGSDGTLSGGVVTRIADRATRVGFVDLSISTTTLGGLSLRNIGGPAEIFSLRTRWTTSVMHGVVWSGNDGGRCSRNFSACSGPFAVKDSEIVSTADFHQQNPAAIVAAFKLNGARGSLVSGSLISYRYWRTTLTSGYRNVLDGNRVVRTNTPGAKVNSSVTLGGLVLNDSVDTVVQKNTFTAKGDYPFNNDGEAILYESAPGDKYRKGTASAATATTLTDSAGLGAANAWAGTTVTIVSGPGAGQSRQVASNTGDTLTVRAAWTVKPTAGSRYALEYRVSGALIKDNVLKDSPRGIWFYAMAVDDAAIVGNTLTDAEGIQVRGDERPSPPLDNQFSPLTRLLVADNTVERTKASAAGASLQRAYIAVAYEDIDGKKLFGTLAYLPEIRRNTVKTIRPNVSYPSDPFHTPDGYWTVASDATKRTATGDATTPGILGAVFDANTGVNLDNAYTIGTGSHQTVIWRAAGTGVTTVVRDLGKNAGKGSTDTVVGP